MSPPGSVHRVLEKKQENGDTIELSAEGRPEAVQEKELPVVDCTCFGLPRRYIIAILSGIGFCISFGIRCNLGVAIVSMVNSHTTFRDNKEVVVVSSTERASALQVTDPAVILCYSTESSVRLGSGNGGNDPRLFLLGIHCNANPRRLHLSKICSKQVGFQTLHLIRDDSSVIYHGCSFVSFSSCRVFGFAIVATSCLNMFIPAAARMHFGCVIIVRVLQGLVEVLQTCLIVVVI